MNSLIKALEESEKAITDEKRILSEIRKIVVKNMKIKRLAKGITLRGAARLLGISASHYSDIENGHRSLTVELAIKADKAFAV